MVRINEGTQTAIATDLAGTLNYQVIKLDIGAAGASSAFTGTIPEIINLAHGTVTISNPTGTTVQFNNGTVDLFKAGTITSLQGGSIVVTNGTIASIPNIPGGTINLLSGGTVTRVEGGSIRITQGTVSLTDSLIPGPFNTISATYPDGTTEVYSYAYGTTSLGSVTVTYTDASKGSVSLVKNT